MKNFGNEKKVHSETSCLAENLIKLLDSHQISENDLAKSLSLPYNTIKRILNGVTSDPRISTLEQIAHYFGVKLDYLLNKKAEPQREKVPIINWDLVADPDFQNNLNRDSWEKWISVAQMENVKDFEQLFALESTKSMHPRFPIGTTFIINTKEQLLDGDIVLIRFKNDNSVSLRELVIDSPHWQLNAIIYGSKSILFNHIEHEIIGIVILTLIQTRIV